MSEVLEPVLAAIDAPNEAPSEPCPSDAALAAADSPTIALELAVPLAQVSQLWRLPPLAVLRSGRTRTAAIRVIWHDTADRHLAEAGRTLSETTSNAGTRRPALWRLRHARRDGATIWPPATPAPSLGSATEPDDLGYPRGRLSPVARFEGQRIVLPLQAGAPIGRVELLTGTLRGAAEDRPIGFLTLEGAPEAVFDLARALDTLAIPLLDLEGEVLALQGRAAPPPPTLRADLDVLDAFVHVVGQLAAILMHHAPDAAAGRRPEPVHQMRVALRRLRSAMSLFRKIADSRALEAAKRELAGLAKALGPARDWDVFEAGVARQVGALLEAEPPVARMAASVKRKRMQSYRVLAELLTGPAYRGTMLGLLQIAVARPWQRTPEPLAERPELMAFAQHALARRLRRVSVVGDDLAPLPAAELHALRIQCKRLRYAAEFFAPLSPGKQTRRFLRRLAAVQERLGHLNDGSVAAELMAELGQKGFAAGAVAGYLAVRTGGERAKAERSWRKFLHTQPFWE